MSTARATEPSCQHRQRPTCNQVAYKIVTFDHRVVIRLSNRNPYQFSGPSTALGYSQGLLRVLALALTAFVSSIMLIGAVTAGSHRIARLMACCNETSMTA